MSTKNWTNHDIENWLKNLGCELYYRAFVDNDITGDLLFECDHEILRSLGVNKVGDRIRIYKSIQDLKRTEAGAQAKTSTEKFLSASTSTNGSAGAGESNLPSLESLNEGIVSPFLIFKEFSASSLASSPNGDETTTKTLRRQASTLTRAHSYGSGAPTAGHSSQNGQSNSAVSGINSANAVTTLKAPLVTNIQSMDVVKQNNLRFIYAEGHTKTVNIAGCHTATDIKNRAMQKALPSSIYGPSPVKANGERYNTYVAEYSVSGPGALPYRRLTSKELMEISQSTDRPERKRLIICEKDHVPTSKQLAKSESMTNTNTNHHNTHHHPQGTEEDHYTNSEKATGLPGPGKYSEPVRRSRAAKERLSGQRPPSELISSNLAHYFPEVKSKELQETVRNSIRFSRRLSRLSARHSTLSSIWPIAEDEDAPPVPSLPAAAADTTDPNRDATLKAEDLSSADRTSLSRLSALSKRLSTLRYSKVRYSTVTDSNGEPYRLSEESDGDDEEEVTSNSDLTSEDDEQDKPDDVLKEISSPSKWIKGKLIGSGSFGTVFLGMNSFTGELMAVKQVELPTETSQDQKHKKSMVEALEREMKLLQEMQHENVVSYLGSSSEDNVLNIFLEYVAGGSVASMLVTYGQFEEPLIKNFVRQILHGINYLHHRNIIHRDIKGANVLVDDKGHIKISDFGISKKIETELQTNRVSLQGSVFWMAPEVVKQKPYTFKADIWSLGCLIVEMYTGTHPFPEFTQMQAIFRIGNSNSPAIPETASPEGRDFLGSAFAVDPEKRPSAAELLNHPFLA